MLIQTQQTKLAAVNKLLSDIQKNSLMLDENKANQIKNIER